MRTIALSTAFFMIAGCIAGARADPAESRIYDLIDLSTPASAVDAYADAFARDDFTLLYFVLDPEAHLTIMMSANRLQYGNVSRITMDQIEAAPDTIANELASDPEKPWMGPDILQIFVHIMALSDINDAHLIDFERSALRAPLAVESVGELFVEDGRARVWVDTNVAGEGPVRFLLQQSPAERWRVLTVVARPGADDEAVFLPYDA